MTRLVQSTARNTMSLTAKLAIAGLVSLAVSCGASPVQPDVPDQPEQASRTEQANLLLFPVADGESLLGRALQQTPDGAWTIADARAPGCQVRARKVDSDFKTRRQMDVRDLTTIAAGFGQLLGHEAKFGRVTKADIDIHNTRVLEGDLQGPCGDVVVGRVFVGTGRRALLATASVGGGVSAAVGPVTPSASHEASTTVVDETSWQSPQAYGFEPKKAANIQSLDLTARIPSIVHEGQDVEIVFETNQKAYLVVYYLDATGKGDVLWPSNELPEPVAQPNSPTPLPAAIERQAGISIKAALLEPDKPSRETLVAYAFSEKEDFDQLKPEVGGSAQDGATYASALTQKLSEVPVQRWSRAVSSYVIVPQNK